MQGAIQVQQVVVGKFLSVELLGMDEASQWFIRAAIDGSLLVGVFKLLRLIN